MTKTTLVVYWCRNEFRMLDNPALFYAVKYAKENNFNFTPLSFLDTNLIESKWMNIGTNRRLILSQILADYTKNFKHYHIQSGDLYDFFEKLTTQYNLVVFVNNNGEPYARKRFVKVHSLLSKNEGKLHIIEDYFSTDKDIKSGSGTIYSMFSPYRNAVLNSFLSSQILPNPNLDGISYEIIEKSCPVKLIYNTIKQPNILYINKNNQISLDEIFEEDNLDNEDSWFISEKDCIKYFEKYAEYDILSYKENRDNMELDAVLKSTSKISQSLAFGLVSTRILKDIILSYHSDIIQNTSLFQYISELLWREFYRYILWHNPYILNTEFQTKYRNTINWIDDKDAIKRFTAWIKGQTGYPIVDAAMNQIAKTGWMHNRARMIVASVLTKNLGVDWRWGQEYFRRQLVDFDEASNNGGWQWASSVGADPKPIRIFNPYLQAETYDKNNIYQKKWLPNNYIPKPIIDHKKAREEAINRYNLAKSTQPTNVHDF